MIIQFQDFEKIDVRVGTIIEVYDFPEARKPAYQLVIDFGNEIGIKRSSAQVTHYAKSALIGKQVIGVINFGPKKIGPFISEVLTLAVPDHEGRAVLLHPTKTVPNGGKLF